MSIKTAGVTLFLCVLPCAFLGCRGTSVKFFDHTVIEGRERAAEEAVRPLVYGGGLALESFDPNGSAGWCEATALLHARLFTVGTSGRLVGDLAQNWRTSLDPPGLRVSLRSAFFHDGRPVTSNDVVVSFRLAAEDPDSETGRNLSAVQGAEAVSDQEVFFRLGAPFPELPAALSDLAVLPAHVMEAGRAALEERPVGAGPFRFAGRQGPVLVFFPHQSYHLGPPRLRRLHLVTIEDDRERAGALAREEIDLAWVKPESLPQLSDTSRFRIHRAATTSAGAERMRRVHQAQARITEPAPWLPLVYADYVLAARREVEDLPLDVVDSWYEWPRHLWRAALREPSTGAAGR